MRFLRLALLLSFIISFSLNAQTEYRDQEFAFTNENDVYIFLGIDRYYSNGLFFNYRFVPESYRTDSLKPKRVFDIGLAHRFWTPQDLRLRLPKNYYRPYAGILNASFRVGEFLKKNKRLSYGVDLGVIGKASGAQAFQEWYHKRFGFPEPRGWENQVSNGLILDFKLEYNHQFILTPGKFDLISSTAGSLGTGFTNLVQRLDIRAGKIQNIESSAFFNSLIGPGSRTIITHSYFFVGYGLEAVAHNSTIQGNLFNADPAITEDIVPWVRHLRLGFATSSARSTLKMTYNWLSKEVRTKAGRHTYVGIELQLRMISKDYRSNR